MIGRVLRVVSVAAAAVLGYVLLSGGDDPYTVNLKLANAGGLKNGSPVVIGGVPIGVTEVDASSREVLVELKIDGEYAPLGKDSSASIIAQNVLGQKQVSVTTGDPEADPAPDGFVIPAQRVTVATDLDQLLGALTPETRTRLAVLLNETGTAFARRKLDLNTFLRDFAPALDRGNELLRQLTLDNQQLDRLLVASDEYIAEFAANKERIGRMVEAAGLTTETVAARRAELRETLARAPQALRSARGLLTELERTTQPLATAARLLARTAPSLTGTLTKLGPVSDAARPLLDHVPYAAKVINQLDRQTTDELYKLVHVLDEAAPVVQTELPPVTDTLDGAIDNTLATAANWAHAIQFRDGLSHVFRGEAGLSPEYYRSVIENVSGLLGLPTRGGDRSKRRPPRETSAPGSRPSAPTPTKPEDRPLQPVQNLLDTLLGSAGGTVQQVEQLTQQLGLDKLVQPPVPGSSKTTVPLLDYLLKP